MATHFPVDVRAGEIPIISLSANITTQYSKEKIFLFQIIRLIYSLGKEVHKRHCLII